MADNIFSRPKVEYGFDFNKTLTYAAYKDFPRATDSLDPSLSETRLFRRMKGLGRVLSLREAGNLGENKSKKISEAFELGTLFGISAFINTLLSESTKQSALASFGDTEEQDGILPNLQIYTLFSDSEIAPITTRELFYKIQAGIERRHPEVTRLRENVARGILQVSGLGIASDYAGFALSATADMLDSAVSFVEFPRKFTQDELTEFAAFDHIDPSDFA